VESVPNHERASSSSTEEASLLIIAVSSQLEAVRVNGKCTIQLIESLVDMVNNLAKEVTHLKNDNVLMQQEIKNLHCLIEASPRLPSQCISKEERVSPAKKSQHLASATLSTWALPIPAGSTFTELSYRDVAAVGLSPPGSAELPDSDRFKTVTHRKRTATSIPVMKLLLQRRSDLADSPSLVLAA
jgi:hypothetical protein